MRESNHLPYLLRAWALNEEGAANDPQALKHPSAVTYILFPCPLADAEVPTFSITPLLRTLSTHLHSIAVIPMEDNIQGDEAIGNQNPEPDLPRPIAVEHGSDEEMQSIASRPTHLPSIEDNVESDTEIDSRWLIAVENGRYEEIQLIARRMGSDRLDTRLLEMRDSEGKSPLHLAAEYGHGNILRYLLEEGASVSARDLEKRTPFILAAECGNSRIL